MSENDKTIESEPKIARKEKDRKEMVCYLFSFFPEFHNYKYFKLICFFFIFYEKIFFISDEIKSASS